MRRFFADNTNKNSVASKLRLKRFALLNELMNGLPIPVSVLDVGGTESYWEMMTSGTEFLSRVRVTLLNTRLQVTMLPNFISIAGDARVMSQFSDKQFDLVFSNSTIEHVGNYSDQKRMANEVTRIGRKYYVQTPNRSFPIEPHFIFPFFQFLPIDFRVWLLGNFKLGWYPRIPDRQKALAEINGIHLLNRFELCSLFPDARIYTEKFLGLTKSFIACTR